MATTDDRASDDAEDSGYGASRSGDTEDAPDQVQPEREPPTEAERASDNYANTDEAASPAA